MYLCFQFCKVVQKHQTGGGKLYRHSIAYFLGNIRDKNYKNLTTHIRVTAKMFGIMAVSEDLLTYLTSATQRVTSQTNKKDVVS